MFTVISKDLSLQVIGGQANHVTDCTNPIDLMEPECMGGRAKDRVDNIRNKNR